jgi:hypothetical protein
VSVPRPVIGLVVSGAGGAETVRDGFVEPATARGWSVAITATPTAARWLRAGGELPALEATTGLPVRTGAELPGGPRPHPRADLVVVAPASANTVAKLALGLADNQALTLAAQAVGDVRTPVIVFPRINAAHARHPAWPGHLAALRSAGVDVVSGDEHWPLHEPGAAPPDRRLPWEHILDRVAAHLLARG